MSCDTDIGALQGFEDIGLVLWPNGDSEHLRGLAELCDEQASLRERA
jgi:hypothetical protein